MLEAMSGRCHKVITGFAVIDTNTGRAVSKAVETAVYFKKISKGDIDKYVATGEPLDKAGGYAIQGVGGKYVDRIEGAYFNVVGLPVNALAKELKNYNIEIPGLSQFDNAAESPAR
jgi:septum formation protein